MLFFSASQRNPPVLNVASSAQNLKKQGILPLLFKYKDDYEVINIFKKFKELGNVILCGDFNRKLKKMFKILEKDWINDFVDTNTEPYTISAKKISLDHFFGLGNIVFDNSKIICVANTSDHNIVLTQINGKD